MRKHFIDCCQILISRSEEWWDKAEILDQKLGYTYNPLFIGE
jgi:hypothetical protein